MRGPATEEGREISTQTDGGDETMVPLIGILFVALKAVAWLKGIGYF